MAAKIKKTFKFIVFLIFFLGLLGGGFYFLQAKTDIFLVSTFVEKSEEVIPNEKIVINFSQSVAIDSYINKIQIFPEQKFESHWEGNNRTLVLTPQEFWQPETEYAVEIGEGRSVFFTNIKKQIFHFYTIKYPIIKSVTPEDGATDVVIDIEDPIIVRFKESFDNFYIRFNVYPATEITYQINPEKTEFRILPKKPLSDGEKYKIDIFAKYNKESDEAYHSIFSSNFETLVPVFAPIVWEKDLNLRVEQAKQFTKPQITEGKYIDINLASQIMTIFENGTVLDSYVVSSGKRGMETSKGRFKIENKALRPWSKAYGLFMPNWMALVPSGKFGIHELPEWPGGYKEGQNHLGTPVSHGCVRLGVGAAKRVFDWAEIGTPVIIY
jgi:lipoprotein-anchoring transpeptidase ErfK/SrfK